MSARLLVTGRPRALNSGQLSGEGLGSPLLRTALDQQGDQCLQNRPKKSTHAVAMIQSRHHLIRLPPPQLANARSWADTITSLAIDICE